MAASFNVHPPCIRYQPFQGQTQSMSLHTCSRGNRIPLKNAPGLYIAFFNASYRWTSSFRPSWLSCILVRTRSSRTPSKNTRACSGFRFEINIRVAAKVECGVHCDGFVSARIRAHWGKLGIILNALGSGPDLYRDSIRPILKSMLLNEADETE